MKRFVRLLLLAALALCALAFASCGMREDTIYYLNFKPESAQVFDRIAQKYKEETGVTLRVVTAASGTYEQTLKSEIGKTDAPALFQINGPVGFNSWKNYCADLSETEIYKHLTDKSLCITEGGKVYGLPYVVEGYGIIYNSEITDRYFQLPNRGTAVASMEEINSFAELKAVVEDMTAHKNELGIEGVFASTSLKSGEDWRWHTHLANVPVYYEFLDREIEVGKPESYRNVYLTYGDAYRNIFDLYINNSVTSPKLLGSKQVADSMAEFALGKCAMVQNGNWAYGQIRDVNGNKVKESAVKFLPIYTGITGEEEQGLCIGTEGYLAINKNVSANKQKMAADFLNWLYTSKSGKEFVINELGFIPPFDTFADEKPKDALSKQVSEWMDREDVFIVPWVFQTFPSQNFKDAVGAALLQYAQGTVTWENVKETFVKEWARETGSSLPQSPEGGSESGSASDSVSDSVPESLLESMSETGSESASMTTSESASGRESSMVEGVESRIREVLPFG